MQPIEQVDVIVNVWGIIIGALVTVMAVLLTALYNQRILNKDRKETERLKLINAAQSLFIEVQSIIKFAGKQGNSRMIWMPTDMWKTHKSAIYGLPQDAQMALTEFYMEVEQVNSIIDADLHKVQWGRGYLDTAYQGQCTLVIKQGSDTKQILEAWLNDIKIKGGSDEKG